MCFDARKDTSFDELLLCRLHLKENSKTVDDVQLFDQDHNLKIFGNEQNDHFIRDLLHVQWVPLLQRLQKCKLFLGNICEFFSYIPGHDITNVKRVFYLINPKWQRKEIG